MKNSHLTGYEDHVDTIMPNKLSKCDVYLLNMLWYELVNMMCVCSNLEYLIDMCYKT